jgi:peptidyl-prolyl cis-trans isomerase C
LPAVVARVNGEAITKEEIETAVHDIEAQAAQELPRAQRDRVIRQMLDQLITARLLTQEGAARKIGVSNAEIEARIARTRTLYPSEDAFVEELNQRGITEARFRANTRRDLLIDKLIAAEVGKAPVTQQELTEYYQRNIADFKLGERVRASHILIRVQANADPAEVELARTKATALLSQAKAGKDFASLAKQESQDRGSGERGGDIGYFEQGQMLKEFEQAAFALKPNELSSVVQSDLGFHVIKVTDRQAPRTKSLEEVRDVLEQELADQHRQQQTQEFIEALRAKAKIDILI